MDSILGRLGSIADRKLLDCDDAERGGDDPACGARNPGPTILIGIELNVTIRCFEFPSPEPMPLYASRFQQPPQRSIAGVGYLIQHRQSAEGESRRPCPL